MARCARCAESERSQVEHQMGDDGAGDTAGELCQDIGQRLAPGQSPVRQSQRHRRVEVGAGDRPEYGDEDDQDRARRYRVAQQCNAALPPASRSAMMPEPTTVATRIAVPSSSATRRRPITLGTPSPPADGLQLLLQGELVQRPQRQADKDRNSVVSIRSVSAKASGFALPCLSPRPDRARPNARSSAVRANRAGFLRGVVADGENDIELRGVGPAEFGPALRAQPAHVEMQLSQQIKRVWMDLAFRLASCRECPEIVLVLRD